VVLDVVLAIGFGEFCDRENRGFGLTPPVFNGFRWFWNSRPKAEFQFSPC